jgi:hypothetical protein
MQAIYFSKSILLHHHQSNFNQKIINHENQTISLAIRTLDWWHKLQSKHPFLKTQEVSQEKLSINNVKPYVNVTKKKATNLLPAELL